MTLDCATIAALNYWPQVRVLAASLAAQDADARVHALVVDLPDGRLPDASEPNIVVHYLSELGLAPWPALAGQFSITEFCTAVKPPFLRRLFDAHGMSRLAYLDPDLMFFASLRPTWERFADADILLTPHFLDPDEADDIALEMLYLQIGTFNLGFLGVADTPNVRRFLDWWERRCWHYNCDVPGEGVYTDQQWINLVPGMFRRVAILEDAGLNVNYHRLRHNRLHQDGAGFRLDDGRPLVFFHFHKFHRAETPQQYFRGHLDAATGQALFDRYTGALRSKRSETQSGTAVAHDTLAQGEAYPAAFRRAYREWLQQTGTPPATEPLVLDEFGRRLAANRAAAPYVRSWSYHQARSRQLGTPEAVLDGYRRSAWQRWWIDAWFYLSGPQALKMPPAWVEPNPLLRGLRRVVGVLLRGTQRLFQRRRSP